MNYSSLNLGILVNSMFFTVTSRRIVSYIAYFEINTSSSSKSENFNHKLLLLHYHPNFCSGIITGDEFLCHQVYCSFTHFNDMTLYCRIFLMSLRWKHVKIFIFLYHSISKWKCYLTLSSFI